MAWLVNRMPRDSGRPGIVHGDWKTDNLVLDPDDPTRLVAALDWEMATIGDPLMDMGYALIFIDERSTPTPANLPGAVPSVLSKAISREELLEFYQQLSGEEVDDPDFYYAFNMFRLAGLLQQLYNRYYHGLSKDNRYEPLGFFVAILMENAGKIVARSGGL
jgi:aminoglycoside phosphotransferase (APT) family kinase protein